MAYTLCILHGISVTDTALLKWTPNPLWQPDRPRIKTNICYPYLVPRTSWASFCIRIRTLKQVLHERTWLTSYWIVNNMFALFGISHFIPDNEADPALFIQN